MQKKKEQKIAERKRQITRQLIGIDGLTEYSLKTNSGSELVFFSVAPSNISVLSEANPELEKLVQKLSEQLKSHKGKKQYGYLQPNVKKTVDEIVLQLSKNDDVAKMYKEWCELEQDKYSTYTNELKTFPPLHENKVFKPIKNRVIDIVSNMTFALTTPECAEQEQDNISESDIEINTDISNTESQDDTSSGDYYFINWTSEYKSACHELYNTKDITLALDMLRKEANKGNVLAMHDVGMIYDRGLAEDENAKALAEE